MEAALVPDLVLSDESGIPKWRVFEGHHLAPGTSKGSGESLTWSVSPGEWTACGDRPSDDAVDLRHVRAAYRLTGDEAATLINRVCALDLSEGMFPTGSAARTLFAGVATEIVRDDVEDVPSYLLLPSRSFGRYFLDVILDAGTEFGLVSN
jgi:heterotetrameric sarcosine oxidase gamma subunit